MNNSHVTENYSRDESSGERLDRNWTELLQELRVMQTGVQLLTGFLLTVPFQSKFDELNTRQIALFLALVICSSVATILLLGVVQLHRQLFRRQVKDRLITHSDQIVRITVVLIGLLILGVCVLVFDIVLGIVQALCVAGGLLLLMAWIWLLYPRRVRRSQPGSAEPNSMEHQGIEEPRAKPGR